MGDASSKPPTGETRSPPPTRDVGHATDSAGPESGVGPESAEEPESADGPVFVISTNDIGVVRGNTEAHYVSRLFGERYETHVFAPLSADLPNVENHSRPFGGVLGVVALNLLFLPYWLYVGWRVRPAAVYCYGNVVVPPFALRAVTDAVVIHDLQCDPYDQTREFAAADGTSRLLSPFIEGVGLAHRLALPRSDAVVALSDDLAATIRRNYGVASENIHVVPLGVDTSAFAPDADGRASRSSRPDAEPTAADPLRIAYLGTIRHYRGLDTVVDGLARLDEDRRERVRFDVFGAGDDAFLADLCEEAETRGVEIVAHGHVDHDEVPAALAECDLAVSPLPPLDAYLVSCPAKVFEYLASGLPVMATDIPPHERYLTDGEDAALFDPDDPESFADAIDALLDAPDALTAMAASARRTALDHDWTDRFRRIEAVVADAQARRDARSRTAGTARSRAASAARERVGDSPAETSPDGGNAPGSVDSTRTRDEP